MILGSAADIIRIAMLRVWQYGELAALKAKMVLQVHDELVLEAPWENAGRAGERVVAIMEGVDPEGVPFEPRLKVDCGIGSDWGAAH